MSESNFKYNILYIICNLGPPLGNTVLCAIERSKGKRHQISVLM